MVTAAQSFGGSDRVRASRDGDSFHYTWAARQLLRLLSPTSPLQYVTIEGMGESYSADELEGSEIVDLAEHYGPSAEEITHVKISQLKHSTLHPNQNLTLGDVSRILDKFAQLDSGLAKKYPDTTFNYSIVTNRPISQNAKTAVETLKTEGQAPAESHAAELRQKTGLSESAIADLCSRLELEDCELGLAPLRRTLNQEVIELLADTDRRALASLIDVVSSRASTQSNGAISKDTVLYALGCQREYLSPAPCLLENSPLIDRGIYHDLANHILQTKGAMVLTAEGGVGKSSFARALPGLLADRADVVIYDCFGKGNYRNSAHSRHRHRDGLVQIATEIAGKGIALPIIPTEGTEPEEYTKAFVRRLRQAGDFLASRNNDHHLVIIVDAADNAAIAAQENADSKAFVCDLLKLKEDIPPNIHIVLTCRPERLPLVEFEKEIPQFNLSAFTLDEAKEFISDQYPLVKDLEATEIHDRTSGNPRVISTLLSETKSLPEAMGRLSNLNSDSIPLDSLMEARIRKAFENSGRSRKKLERIARLLALLRPSIPLDIIEQLARTDIPTIRSFIADFGPGLVIEGENVQFLDEPTETYFRKTYFPKSKQAEKVASRLEKLSGDSIYASLSLPEVLWTAKFYDQLLDLVTTDKALPKTSNIERIQVKNLRIEFGLRAAVQLKRNDLIVQLALQAGDAYAGKSRQYTIIRDNPDLAGLYMSSKALSNLIATRELPHSWPGSTLGAEAVLLASNPSNLSSARSRTRQAMSAIWAATQAKREQYSRDEEITPDQIGYIALALLKTDGHVEAVRYISSWRPSWLVLKAGAALTRMLITSASDEDISCLVAKSTHPALLLGIFGELQSIGIDVGPELTEETWVKLKRYSCSLAARNYDMSDAENLAFRGVSWICALAIRYSVDDFCVVAERLSKCLPASPPFGLGSDYRAAGQGILFAIALQAKLIGETLSIEHFRPTELKEPLDSRRVRHNDEELRRGLESALIWLNAWAEYACGHLKAEEAVRVIESYGGYGPYGEVWSTALRIKYQVLPLLGIAFEDNSVSTACEKLIQNITKDASIAGATILLPGLRGEFRFASVAIQLANTAREALTSSDEFADQKAETLIHIARGLHPFSKDEAKSYFDQAVTTASGLGYETHRRWNALIALAHASKDADSVDVISLAQRIGRLGESVSPVIDGGIDQSELVSKLTLLSGTHVFRFLSQWRDRRFGSLDSQLVGVTEKYSSLLASRPDIAILLSPFCKDFNLDQALERLEAANSVDVETRLSVNSLARRIGYPLNAETAQLYIPDAPWCSSPTESTSIEFDFTSEQKAERTIQKEQLMRQISGLNLTQPEDINTAIQLQKNNHEDIFTETVFSHPELQWGRILEAAMAASHLNAFSLANLLNEALKQRRDSRSFVGSLKNAVTTYIERYGTELIQHNWMRFDVDGAAELLKVSRIDVLKYALEHLNLEEVLIDAERCYMLTAGASAVLRPEEAARVLNDAVTSLEEKLELPPTNPTEQIAVTDSIDAAVASFLWTALGDPRSAIRWQAAHAVRTAIEIGVNDVTNALVSTIQHDDIRGYGDSRFHFYRMNAAEWFLIAVRRVAGEDSPALSRVMPAVKYLSEQYPDHAMIQQHCSSIARTVTVADEKNDFVGTDWVAQLKKPIISDRWNWADHPNPKREEAPQAEYSFHFDFDEHILGELTKSVNIDHQEVLDATSKVILDEWGWRCRQEWESSKKYIEDPRRIASIYEDGETYAYKPDVPKAEDLSYYLERHAALTVAGRLMKTASPYQDPDSEQPEILYWLSQFDIARKDGRWITDQRNLVPNSLANTKSSGDGSTKESEFIDALHPADNWLTVWQSAHATDSGDRSLSVDVRSALVNAETAPALVRALQSTDTYWNFRIPSADTQDEEFQFLSSPFLLKGWISEPYSDSGVDRLDSFAKELPPELPRPSTDVINTLGMKSSDGGMHWINDTEDILLASDAWSSIIDSHPPVGPEGRRLRITTETLDRLLNSLDLALIVEVRIHRKEYNFAGSSGSNSEEESENYGRNFRIFSYRPESGWSDIRGNISVRESVVVPPGEN